MDEPKCVCIICGRVTYEEICEDGPFRDESRCKKTARQLAELQADKAGFEWLAGTDLSLLSDDCGRWCVTGDGTQPVTEVREGQEIMLSDGPIGGDWWYVVEHTQWKNSIREAIDAAMGEGAVPLEDEVDGE